MLPGNSTVVFRTQPVPVPGPGQVSIGLQPARLARVLCCSRQENNWAHTAGQAGRVQVLVRVEASGICGSDIRAIYKEHTGKGDEAVKDIIAGHEPCGQVLQARAGSTEPAAGCSA